MTEAPRVGERVNATVCPTCGSAVVVEGSGEGTRWYRPVGYTTELAARLARAEAALREIVGVTGKAVPGEDEEATEAYHIARAALAQSEGEAS